MTSDQETLEAFKTYISTLKEKYRIALADESEALEQLEGARRRKEIYASTLREEGVDPRIVESTVATYRIKTGQLFSYTNGTNGNGNTEKPLSDTHAVYIAIRKHGNTGFSFGELAKFSTELGHPLTEEDVKKVFWKQKIEERMTKQDDKVYLTKDGETFNRFRAPVR